MTASLGFHKIKIKETLVCHHCSQEFLNTLSHNKHHVKEHHDKPFVCNFCQQEFLDKNLYLKHRHEKHMKPYACNVCNFRTSYLRNMKHHVKTRPGKCKTNDKKELSNVESKITDDSLGYHKIKTEQKYFCCHCSQEYVDLQSFDKHHTATHPDKKFICEHCQKQFLERKVYTDHKHSYHSGKNYACNTCDFRARRNVMLKHVEKHFMQLDKGQQIKFK